MTFRRDGVIIRAMNAMNGIAKQPPMRPATNAEAGSSIGNGRGMKFKKNSIVRAFACFMLLIGWGLLMTTSAAAQGVVMEGMAEDKPTFKQQVMGVPSGLDAENSEGEEKQGNGAATRNAPEGQGEHGVAMLAVTVKTQQDNAVGRDVLYHELHRERNVTDGKINALGEKFTEKSDTQDWKINEIDKSVNQFVTIILGILALGGVWLWGAIKRHVNKSINKRFQEILGRQSARNRDAWAAKRKKNDKRPMKSLHQSAKRLNAGKIGGYIEKEKGRGKGE